MTLHFIEVLKVVFLGIMEGINEWLLISNTGHLLLVDEFVTLNRSTGKLHCDFISSQGSVVR